MYDLYFYLGACPNDVLMTIEIDGVVISYSYCGDIYNTLTKSFMKSTYVIEETSNKGIVSLKCTREAGE